MACAELFSFYYCLTLMVWLTYFSNISDANLCHQLTRVLIEMKAAIRGISLLKLAIRKIQTSEAQLTSIHADLCQLCLKAKCFKPALEFLDTDITTISEEVQFILINYPVSKFGEKES